MFKVGVFNLNTPIKSTTRAPIHASEVVVDILSTTTYSEATSFILIKMTIWFN